MFASLQRKLWNRLPVGLRREAKRVLLRQPRLCLQIYAWVKENPRHAEIVKEFWGPHRRQRHLPRSLDGGQSIPENFSEHLEYPLYEKTLVRMRNVTMRGREGVLFLPDGRVSHQTGWALEQVTETDAYKNKWKRREVFKRGNFSTLILYWGLAYYHWFKDVLAMLHESLEWMPGDTIFVMPKGFQKVYGGDFYLKSLEALGIARDRVVEFDGTESWTFENLWWQPPAVHPDDQPPGAMQWIGQKITESVTRQVDEKPVRVYISRSLPFARVLANEDELLPGLIDMGFQVCRLENMTFEEQVRLFRNAEVVVGPHGAGFTNLIFAKPGTRVVEILAKGYERRCYWTLSAELAHDYQFYLGTPKFPERKGEPDIEVEPSRLCQSLAVSMKKI